MIEGKVEKEADKQQDVNYTGGVKTTLHVGLKLSTVNKEACKTAVYSLRVCVCVCVDLCKHKCNRKHLFDDAHGCCMNKVSHMHTSVPLTVN